MRDKLQAFLEVYQKYKTRRVKMISLLLVVSLVVFGNVFWQLRHTGITMTNETSCGIIAHEHNEACAYELVSLDEEYVSGTDLYVLSGSDAYLVSGTDAYSQSGSSVVSLSDLAASGYYYMVYTCGYEEHTHVGNCYSDPSAVETKEQWEATIPTNLSGIWASDLVTVARSQLELGYTESAANYVLADDGTRKGYTRYGDWYGNKYGDWDAMFVSFCLSYAGIPDEAFPYYSGAYGWPSKLKEAECWYDAADTTPYIGDVIFFDTDSPPDGLANKVGIVSSVNYTDGTFTVIEGNCDDTIKENTYTMSDATILGYGVVPTAPAYVDLFASNSGRTPFDKEHVVNLTQTYSGQVAYDPINGTYAIINFSISFDQIVKTLAPDNLQYVYDLPEGLSFSAATTDPNFFNTIHTHELFTAQFVDNGDGTYSIFLNFVDEILEEGVTVKNGSVTFNCTASADFLDENGNLVIPLPGGTVTVPSTDLSYPENETHNYDISTTKVSSYDKDNGIITYTVTVTSDKGTPSVITLEDVLTLGSGDYVLSAESVTGPTVEKRYYPDGNSGSYESSEITNFTTTTNSDSAIPIIELPQIINEDGYTTSYVITYAVKVSERAAGATYYISNEATASSTGTSEKVSNTAKDSFEISNDVISKFGYYDSSDRLFHWSITFNGSGNNVVGAQLLDTKFAVAENLTVHYMDGTEVSPDDGSYSFVYDSDGKLAAIEFAATADSTTNTNTYVVKYTTAPADKWEPDKQSNIATYDPTPGDGDTTGQKTADAEASTDPNHLDKNFVSATSDPNNEHQIFVKWQTTATVPGEGIPSGTEILDKFTDAWGYSSSQHKITYDQLCNIAATITNADGTTSSFTNFTIKASDNNSDWYSLSDIASNSYYQTLDYTHFKIIFNEEITADEASAITFEYTTTANTSSVTSQMTIKNETASGDNTDKYSENNNYDYSEYSYTPNVVKLDNAHSNTQTPTTFESSDGKVSWGIYVNLPEDYTYGTPVTIVDYLPSNADLELVGVEIGHGQYNKDSFIISEDGTLTYSGDNQWWTSGYSGTYNEKTGMITLYFDGNNNDVVNSGQIYVSITCKVLNNYVSSTDIYSTDATHTLDNTVDVSINSTPYDSDHQQQTVTIPKTTVTEPDVGGGEEEEDKKEPGGKYLASWADPRQRENLAYSIDVNIHATNFVSTSPVSGSDMRDTDVIYLADTLSYNPNAWQSTPQEFILLHDTVALYYAVVDAEGKPVLDSSGRLQKGEAVPNSEWSWKYYEDSSGNPVECIITATVPDGVALVFEYEYRQVTDSPDTESDDYVSASNSAKLMYNGVIFEEYQYNTYLRWQKYDVTLKYEMTRTYSFIKEDADNPGTQLYGTTFALYEFNPDISTYEEVWTYTTEEDDPTTTSVDESILQIHWQCEYHDNDYQFKPNTSYYIVEKEAPTNYREPDYPTPYYFYFSDDESDISNISSDEFLSKAVDLSTSSKTEYVANERNVTDISVKKTWLDSDGTDISDKQNGSIVFKLYQVASEYNPELVELNFALTSTNDSNTIYRHSYYVTPGTSAGIKIYMPKDNPWTSTSSSSLSVEATGERFSTSSTYVYYDQSTSNKGYYLYTLSNDPFITTDTTILGSLSSVPYNSSNSAEIIYVTEEPTNTFLKNNQDKIIVYVKAADKSADSSIDTETGEIKNVTFTLDTYHNYYNDDIYFGNFTSSYKYGSTVTVTSYAALTSSQYYSTYAPYFRHADDESVASTIPSTANSTVTSGDYTIVSFTTDPIVLNGDDGIVAFTNYGLENHTEYGFVIVTEPPTEAEILANPGKTYFYVQVDESTAGSSGSGDSGDSGDTSTTYEAKLYYNSANWGINTTDNPPSTTITESSDATTYSISVTNTNSYGDGGVNQVLYVDIIGAGSSDITVSDVAVYDNGTSIAIDDSKISYYVNGDDYRIELYNSYVSTDNTAIGLTTDDFYIAVGETFTIEFTVKFASDGSSGNSSESGDSGSGDDSGSSSSSLTVNINKNGTTISESLSGYSADDVVNVTIYPPSSSYYGGGWLYVYAGTENEGYTTTLVTSSENCTFSNIVLDESLSLYGYIGDGGSELLITDNASDAVDDSGKYIVYVEKATTTAQYSLRSAVYSLTSSEEETVDTDSSIVISNLDSGYTVSLYVDDSHPDGIYTITSDDDWKKIIPDLPLSAVNKEDGKTYYYSYYIEEVSVAGFDTTYSNITSDGVITTVVDDETVIKITNKSSGKYALVETGGPGTAWCYIIAAMLFVLAGIIYKFNLAPQSQTVSETADADSKTVSFKSALSAAKQKVLGLIMTIRKKL